MGRRHAGPPQGPLRPDPPRRRATGASSRRPATPVDARIINTSSGAGLMGSVGQGTYSAAKAGIAALTLVESAELGRYGVTANAIAPAARTRMTEAVFAETMAAPGEGEFDAMAPENVVAARGVAGLAESDGVTGRVFEVEGGKISGGRRLAARPRVRQGRPLGARRGRRRRRATCSPRPPHPPRSTAPPDYRPPAADRVHLGAGAAQGGHRHPRRWSASRVSRVSSTSTSPMPTCTPGPVVLDGQHVDAEAGDRLRSMAASAARVGRRRRPAAAGSGRPPTARAR